MTEHGAAQLALAARIMEWEPPADVRRLLHFDSGNAGSVHVMLEYNGLGETALIPPEATDHGIKATLDFMLFYMRHLYDTKIRTLDLGPFELVDQHPQCGENLGTR